MDSDIEARACEYCERRTQCGNIYVALKILESEMRYCASDELKQRFVRLYHRIVDSGYGYPGKVSFCSLAEDKAKTAEFLRQLEDILQDVRAQNKIA